MFSASDAWKRNTSWLITPTASRQALSSHSSRATPPARTRPACGSWNPSTRSRSVDLPAARADDADDLAGRRLKAHITDRGPARFRIGKADISDLDRQPAH